jgi:hypothetical protein
MTIEAVRQGWSHENFAYPTDRYSTLEEAKRALSIADMKRKLERLYGQAAASPLANS